MAPSESTPWEATTPHRQPASASTLWQTNRLPRFIWRQHFDTHMEGTLHRISGSPLAHSDTPIQQWQILWQIGATWQCANILKGSTILGGKSMYANGIPVEGPRDPLGQHNDWRVSECLHHEMPAWRWRCLCRPISYESKLCRQLYKCNVKQDWLATCADIFKPDLDKQKPP